jgi:hypothetical protein
VAASGKSASVQSDLAFLFLLPLGRHDLVLPYELAP